LQPGTDIDPRLPPGVCDARRRSRGESNPGQRVRRRYPDAARGQLNAGSHGRAHQRQTGRLPARWHSRRSGSGDLCAVWRAQSRMPRRCGCRGGASGRSTGMSILLDRSNRVLVQGITGQMGMFFVDDARKYGTQIVAGVSPGRAGTMVRDVPVYASVRAAREATGADTAMVFVPPAAVLGAAVEAIEGGCKLVVATADEMPVLDAIEVRAAARANGAVFVGPNTPGLISPGKAKMGFMPSFCYVQGHVGVISRSGSLSYEGCKRLTLANIGQSTVVGIGGDPVKGT